MSHKADVSGTYPKDISLFVNFFVPKMLPYSFAARNIPLPSNIQVPQVLDQLVFNAG